MELSVIELPVQVLTLVPVIIGLVQVVKKAGLNKRFVPAMSVVLGMVGAYFYIGSDVNSVMFGIIAGLSSCGLWSGVKTSSEN